MDNQIRPGERMEHATTLYEYVRMVQERLYDIEAELDADEFARYSVSDRAKVLTDDMQRTAQQLATLVQQLQLRPNEDSSDAPLDSEDASDIAI